MNSSKTEFLVVVSPSHQHLIDITKPLLRIGCNLGVILDAQMTMHQHVMNIVRSGNAHLHSLGRVRRYLNDIAATAVARTLLLLWLHYTNALLTGISNKVTNRLQVVQNSAAHIVTRTSPRSHITLVLQELHYLPVRLCVFHKVVCLAYKAHSSTAPAHLSSLVQRRQHTRSLRSSTDGSLLTVP